MGSRGSRDAVVLPRRAGHRRIAGGIRVIRKESPVKLPIPTGTQNLCEQCVALCCRYYAFEIDRPRTHRDFEDLRWYLLHEDTIIFVEAARWYIQVNRPCKALLPDNRCGVYENRPTICRGYTAKNCDWHGDDYDYTELFAEPEQIERYGKAYLAARRRRRRKKATAKKGSTAKRSGSRAKAGARAKTGARSRRTRARTGVPVGLLKSA